MHKVSSEYKKCMDAMIRNRAYISIGVGVVNQEAQKSAESSGNFTYFSNADSLFDAYEDKEVYAGLDQNFIKADGNAYFVPEDDELSQYKDTGITTSQIKGSIRIDFGNIYAIKGLTLYFPNNCYPTEFEVKTEHNTLDFSNDSEVFTTTEVLGDTSYIVITPKNMVGGQQRFRLVNAVMGVGLNFGNADVQDSSYSEYISSISEEVSSIDFSVNIFDKENKYNVDDDNSFINFLEIGQNVSVSEGLELDDGTIEWVQLGNLKLDSWSQKKGMLTLNACDIFAQMEDRYDADDRIFSRTAYQQAINILADMGYEADQYIIDDYLKSITLVNPMPTGTHKECLQILANACRCIVYQNSDGKIVVRGNFATVLDPEDLTISTNGEMPWSHSENIIVGTSDVYAELNENFIKADGSFYFVLEDGEQYLDTGYVSAEIADENGNFEINPTISVKLPSGYTYYGININFDGNPAKELIIHTFYNGKSQENVVFADLESENTLFYEFSIFDELVIEFTKGAKNNRILVNKIGFGDATDYVLKRNNMTSEPNGYKEGLTKKVRVKIFTFEEDDQGNPQEVDDDVFVEKQINTTGAIKTLENPLIHDATWAQEVAEWLANYYANNVSYSVDYRGDPRLNAQDIIHMESEVIDNLQVEIEKLSLSFNGGWRGSLDMRKALKLV